MNALTAFADTPLMTSLMPKLSAPVNGNTALDKTARDFEAMFATQMLQPMFEGIGVDPVFGGGHGEEVMKSFMLQEYGKIIAQTGKLGIADQVKSEMLRLQEAERKRNDISNAQAITTYQAPLNTNPGDSHVTP